MRIILWYFYVIFFYFIQQTAAVTTSIQYYKSIFDQKLKIKNNKKKFALFQLIFLDFFTKFHKKGNIFDEKVFKID